VKCFFVYLLSAKEVPTNPGASLAVIKREEALARFLMEEI
jgi:hypothetical protein